MNHPSPTAELIARAHQLYGRLTGQSLRLGLDRERQWFDLLRQGFSLEDVEQVIRYLQREIRHGRRYVGALKLSNLLQPDRFEEDLNISRVQLKRSPPSPQKPSLPPPPQLSCEQREQRRQLSLQALRKIKEQIG